MLGPNGSGKTTLMRCLLFTMMFAADSNYDQDAVMINGFIPFLKKEMINQPARIELEFDSEWLDTSISDAGSVYRYVVEIDRNYFNDPIPSVRYESVYSFAGGRSRRLLERKPDKPVYLAKEFNIRPGDSRLSDIPPKVSAISAFDRMEIEPFYRLAQYLRTLSTDISMLSNVEEPWCLEPDEIILEYKSYPELVNSVSEKLRRLDLGIEYMEIAEVPDAMMVFKHRGLDSPVPFEDESAGARNLALILPTIEDVLNTGGLAIMDSLDSHFTTELLLEILNWFRRKQTNPYNAQLVCSLYNPAVLDHLEKEEVYIVEKDRGGATHAYGLRDVRGLGRNESLQKQYRSGSLGGLPTFG